MGDWAAWCFGTPVRQAAYDFWQSIPGAIGPFLPLQNLPSSSELPALSRGHYEIGRPLIRNFSKLGFSRTAVVVGRWRHL